MTAKNNIRRISNLVLVLLLSNSMFSQSAKEIAKSCLPSTVSLVMEDSFKQPISLGSGFIIGNGKVVTNLHVIEGAKYGSVFVNGSSTKHKIEGYFIVDKKNDLAILSIPSLTDKALPLGSTSAPEVGEKIYAIGNPKGLSGTISEGIVSGIRTLDDHSLIQITAPISPGSSGGPVINNKGEVVGVAVGTLTSGQNLNFAIPTSLLIALIDKHSSSITPLNISKGVTVNQSGSESKNIVDGVSIENVEWRKNDYLGPGTTVNYELRGFSIKNELPYEIKNLKILFVLKTKTGTPIDYAEKKYFDYSEGINPFLAKYIETWGSGYIGRVWTREIGEKLEIRILDFEIIED